MVSAVESLQKPRAAHLARFECRRSDPDQLVEDLKPVAPGVSIHPQCSGHFASELSAVRFPRLALFTIRLTPAQVVSPVPRDFLSVTLPLGGALEICERGHSDVFEQGSFHVLRTTEPFDLKVLRGGPVLVANFDTDLIQDHAHSFDARAGWEKRIRSKFFAGAPGSSSFRRLANFVWSELQRKDSFIRSLMVAREVEDALAATLLQVSLFDPRSLSEKSSGAAAGKALRRAEDFLMAHLTGPVSLAKVSQEAGVSVRTLSRIFHRHHGSSVMQYLKTRRLEAVRRELISAEPEGTSVTEVALRHGFGHLGRFSSAYRRAFGELPSESLRR